MNSISQVEINTQKTAHNADWGLREKLFDLEFNITFLLIDLRPGWLISLASCLKEIRVKKLYKASNLAKEYCDDERLWEAYCFRLWATEIEGTSAACIINALVRDFSNEQ